MNALGMKSCVGQSFVHASQSQSNLYGNNALARSFNCNAKFDYIEQLYNLVLQKFMRVLWIEIISSLNYLVWVINRSVWYTKLFAFYDKPCWAKNYFLWTIVENKCNIRIAGVIETGNVQVKSSSNLTFLNVHVQRI